MPPASPALSAQTASLSGHGLAATRAQILLTGFVVFALAAGCLLRVLWYDEMEYRVDERWTFERTRAIGVTEDFPWLGMHTSNAMRHPGGSIWIFLGLARLSGAETPDQLGLACQLSNCLALLLLAWFALVCVPREEREPWLWAVALAALNPTHIFLHRKIWPPTITPLPLVLFLIAWWHRRGKTGAFFWGLLGAWLGQIHPAGMFLAAGFFLWTVLFGGAGFQPAREGNGPSTGNAGWKPTPRAAWSYWLAGSVLGALTLLPWFHFVLTGMHADAASHHSVKNLLAPLFFLRFLLQPLGLQYPPYLHSDFLDCLRYPLLAGRPTFLVGAAYLAMVLAALLLLGRGLRFLWTKRGDWGTWLRRPSSDTSLALSAGLLGFGLILTATLLKVHSFYMVLAFPFMFLALAKLALAGPRTGWLTGRKLLAGLGVAQFLLTLGMLWYVHSNPREIKGYGTPYRTQVAERGQ